MNITPDTPRAEITIQGATFQAPEPFEEGHQLNENEAAALNQLLHENLRNNFASKVKDALGEVQGKVDDLDMTALQSEFDKYAEGYEFGVRRTGVRVPKDPVQHEAVKIAGALVRKALAKNKIKVAELPEGKFDELVTKYAQMENVQAAARSAADAKAAAAAIALDGVAA